MGKLTKAQRVILERLRDGHKLTFFSGRTAFCSWGPGNFRDERAPSTASVHALWKKGFADSETTGIGTSRYFITDAGRAALREPT